MAGNALKITLDTNCVINLFDQASESATSVDELKALVRHAMEGDIEISVTTRVKADLLNDKDRARCASLLGHLQLFPVVPTLARWDVSNWDEDLWAGDEDAELSDDIQNILSPGLDTDDRHFSNKVNDIDHLTGHKIAGRDIFVTDDRGIRKKGKELADRIGILVMSPSQCLEELRSSNN